MNHNDDIIKVNLSQAGSNNNDLMHYVTQLKQSGIIIDLISENYVEPSSWNSLVVFTMNPDDLYKIPDIVDQLSWEASEAFAKTFVELTPSVTKPTKPTIEVEYLRLCKHNTKKLVCQLFELTNSDYKHLLSIFELPGSLLKCTNINADPDMQTTLKVEGCARSQFTPIDVYTLYSFLRSYSIGNERIHPEKINDLLKTMKSEGNLKDSRKG